jgi:diguanylate cyclase (GGDEF)-like protein
MSKLLSLRKTFIVWTILFLAFDGIFWALLLLQPIGHARLVAVDDVLQCIGPLLAVLLCLGSLRRQRHKAALFLGLGTLAYVVGQSIWGYYELIIHQTPFPSIADIAYLTGPSLLLIGILFLPARPLLLVSRTRMALDSLMIMTAILTFSWYFVLGPTILGGDNSLLAKIVGTAYPCSDVVLLLCLLLQWARQDDRQILSVLLLLSLGLITIVLADSMFDYLNLHNSYATTSLIDPLWSLGYQCIGLTALALLSQKPQIATTSSKTSHSLGRSLLPYAFIPAMGLLLLYIWYTPGDKALQPGAYVGIALLVGLILLRQIIAMRELHTLYINNDALAVANSQLEVLATYDTLTTLPNRNLLHRRLELATHAAREGDLPTALLLLDLNRFKEVNDTLGHDIGDLLLQEIGPRLRSCLRSTDLISRMGGDEFALVLTATDTPGAVHVAHTILEAFEAPFLIGSHAFDIGVSIGIALTPEHGFEVSTLLRCADVAMYVAKRNQSGYATYTHETDEHSPRKLALMRELRLAIAEGALVLHYQPKISLSRSQLVGVEALVRWPHPTYGLIQPNEFIPLAETTGLIAPLTSWVLEQAIRQCRDWKQVGLLLNVAVNLSTRTLYDLELLTTVKSLLQTYGVASGQLTLEITEGTLMEDPERARTALTNLRTLGVLISLDDFGTGYSSLAYLKRLPLDEIKIDKAFVLGLGLDADPADVAIVRAVIAMARPLQCEVVAEGVENMETWMSLREFGCDMAQGYYLSRPLPAAALEPWARTAPWRIPKQEGSLVSS